MNKEAYQRALQTIQTNAYPMAGLLYTIANGAGVLSPEFRELARAVVAVHDAAHAARNAALEAEPTQQAEAAA